MRLAPETDPLARQLAFVFAAIGGLAALAFRWRGPAILHAAHCPLLRMTGIPCPTCGGTHAAAALARLDLGAALRANPLVVVAALAVAVWVACAAAATLRPAWRRRLELSPAERRALRAAVALALLGAWAYQIVRLR